METREYEKVYLDALEHMKISSATVLWLSKYPPTNLIKRLILLLFGRYKIINPSKISLSSREKRSLLFKSIKGDR